MPTARLLFALSIGLAGWAGSLLAADGELDTRFSLDGWTAIDFDLPPERDDYANSVVALPDGHVAVAGSAYGALSGRMIAVTRLRADGVGDPAFGDGGLRTFRFEAIEETQFAEAVLAHPEEEKLVVVNAFGSDDRIGLTRLLESGEFDPDFGDDSTPGRTAPQREGFDEIVIRDAAIFGAGRILVAGRAERPGGAGSDGFVARFLENGDTDLFFGEQGIAWLAFDRGGSDDDEVTSLTVQDDGRIVALLRVETDDAAGDVDTGIVRLDATGDPDPQFGGAGDLDPGFALFALTDLFGATADAPESVAVQPDGRIVFGGTNASSANGNRCYLARLLPSGATDPSLAAELHDVDGESWIYCQEVVVQSDGRLLLAGSTIDGCFALRLDADGQALDPSFGDAGQSVLSPPGATATNCIGAGLSGGRLVVAGTRYDALGDDDFYVARLTSDLIFRDGFESASREQWTDPN
jgi:uncharacterized delta-60 repeat protein